MIEHYYKLIEQVINQTNPITAYKQAVEDFRLAVYDLAIHLRNYT